MNLTGRRVLVVGLGISGASAARVLLELGARVLVVDEGSSPALASKADRLRALGAEVTLGTAVLDTSDVDLAILSPGVPPTSPVPVQLAERGIEMWSEVELAYRLASCDFLAVTGTNGKTTTTTLLAAMLGESGIPSVAAGNIGLPLVDAVADVPQGGAIAVEVSSFQLATIHRFRPKVAVLLNIASDHMDYHGSMTAYAQAKARITENQNGDDTFVFNFEDERARSIGARSKARSIPFSGTTLPDGGAGVADGWVVVGGTRILPVEEVPLPGTAGLEDCVAAAAAAVAYGVDVAAVQRAVKGFVPLRHRFELIAEVDGVRYIDDSKATNPHATLAALRGMSDVVLIAGGRSKGIDLSPLADGVPPIRAVVAIGEAQQEIVEVFAGKVPVDPVASMEDAVTAARARSVSGGSVLLSPGCASLDMYESYAARGDHFARCVKASIASGSKGGNRGLA